MLNFLKNKTNSKEFNKNKNIQLALCALLLEVAHCDDEFNDEERNIIIKTVKNKFDLSSEAANDLIEVAENERKNSVDLWHFTKQINENYSHDEKFELMEMLWKVVFADNNLDKHEDYIIHTMNKLLKMDHKDMIAAKIKARDM